jgi:hypothetical protein
MTYYDYEVNRLGTLPADLKLQNEHGETRWITVTPAQIEAILEILNQTEEQDYYPPDVYASRDSLEALNDD